MYDSSHCADNYLFCDVSGGAGVWAGAARVNNSPVLPGP